MPASTSSTHDLLQTPALKSAISKASRRLMPMLVILYVVAFLDRTNVGFAAEALEVAILDRSRPRRAFRRIKNAELEGLLA